MAHRTPAQIQRFLDEHQHKMDSVLQFLGDEPNSYRKPWDASTVRWLVAASWVYEQAAGNQSVPLVYKSINLVDRFLADRYYLPDTPRDLHTFAKNGYPIFGIESKHQAVDFDVVSTSLAYSVLGLSWIKMLRMSDIPPRRVDRASAPERYPMVVVGGQLYGTPESMAPIVDAFWLGECEDEPGQPGIARVCARIEQFKAEGAWTTVRAQCYDALAREFPFLYFPHTIEVDYGYEDRGLEHPTKLVTGYRTTLAGMRAPLVKRIVKNLDAAVALDNPPLLYVDPGLGSGDIEVARGCPAWCSFCALTYRQKPYRQRSVPYMVDFAQRLQRNVGGTHLTPFSPDFPMHTEKKKLISGLLENVCDEVDSPAGRVDDFIADENFLLLQVHGGMDTVTVGVEGNSQRMRDFVGKGASDEDIRELVTRGIRAGIRKFKLFMITALPGEDEGDTFRVLKLAKDLADIRDSMGQPGIRIQFSWTPLLVEGNTPFQWFAVPEVDRSLGDIWDEFRGLRIDFKIGAKGEPNKVAYVQACQRASREVGEAITDVALELDQATWGGVPRYTRDLLIAKIKEHGFFNGLDDIFDERFHSDMFGWEFIDQGVSPELLWVTYQAMREFLEETDSHTYDLNFGDDYKGNEWIERCDTRCMGRACGACDAQDLKIRQGYIRAAKDDHRVDLVKLKVVDQRSVALKVRARLHKSERYRFVGNDHWRFAFRRAAYRATATLGHDWGIAKRTVHFASDTLRGKDWSYGTDYVEFGVTRRVSVEAITRWFDEINKELEWYDPNEGSAGGMVRWLTVYDWQLRPAGSSALRRDADSVLYEIEAPRDVHTVTKWLSAWQDATYVPMTLQAEASYFAPATEEVNAKDFVPAIWLVRAGHQLKVRMLVRGRPSPYNVYAALRGKTTWMDAAGSAVARLDAFVDSGGRQEDFFYPSCVACGDAIPINLLEVPYHADLCPLCGDVDAKRAVWAPSRALVKGM